MSVKKSDSSTKNQTKIPNSDVKLIEESFGLVKNLNTQVAQVQIAKEKLQKDVESLGKQLEKQEISNSKNSLANIKNEILKELVPVFDKLNKDIFSLPNLKNVEKIIETELAKIKSELDSNSKRTQREFVSKVSEIESKILESISSNSDLKNQLEKFEKTELLKIRNEIEEKLHESLQSASENYHSLSLKNAKQVDSLKDSLEAYKTQTSHIEKTLEEFRGKLSTESSGDQSGLASIEAKISKLAAENSEMKAKIRKYDANLQSDKGSSDSKTGKKFETVLSETQKKLDQLAKDKAIHDEFLIGKINEVIENVNHFEDKLSSLEKTGLAGLSVNREKKLKENINKFKGDASNLSKQDIVDLNSDLKEIKSDYLNFASSKKELEQRVQKISDEIEMERTVFKDKINEVVDNFNNLENTNKDLLNSAMEGIDKSFEEKFAKNLLSNNEFLTRLNVDLKEKQKKLHEDSESNFFTTKEQFEKEFKSHLSSFETELKSKESEFLNKLNAVELEKAEMLKELENFKAEIASIGGEYAKNLDEELQKIKLEESNFAVEKSGFLSHIDELVSSKKKELDFHSSELEERLGHVLNAQKESFERNEGTFREVFHEKVSSLQDIIKKKLDGIEKKFVEKNMKIVDSRLDEGSKNLTLIEARVDSKLAEFKEREEFINSKNENFEVELLAQENKLKERIESRLTELEKNFNKRFLDYDNDFSAFKSAIVDEVEDLVKEVNTVLESKVDLFEKNNTKLNFLINEGKTRVENLGSGGELIDKKIKDIADEVSSLNLKMEIMTPQMNTMNDHVMYMKEYESQLFSLVTNLKSRGMGNSQILKVVANKGHPRFYVSMILENYDKITN